MSTDRTQADRDAAAAEAAWRVAQLRADAAYERWCRLEDRRPDARPPDRAVINSVIGSLTPRESNR